MSPSAMLQLYRVLFLGFLRYSLPALSNLNKTSRRMLQSIQAQTLRICLGLPQSASTVATIAIAKDHFVKTHIEIEALRTHIRHLARTPHHHLASLPVDRPRTSFCRTVTAHSEALPTGFTPAARPSVPPWCLKQPTINLTIPGVQKKQDLSAPALKQLALFLLDEKYHDSTHVYTDGSVLPSSSTAAVVIPTFARTIKLRKAHPTTSTAAEIAALRAALHFINDQMRKRWTIFCDSKTALQSLLSTLRRGPHEQLVFETAEMLHHLTEKGHHITFQWLPSHCGIIGNERADQAARSAHTEDRDLSIPLSRTDAARKLRMLARQYTTSNWNEPHFMHPRLHCLDPTLSLRIPPRLRRGDATVLCRLWLGVAFTRAYAFRIGMADTAACEHCGNEETIRHVLCDCPKYTTQRQCLCQAFNKLDDEPLSEERLLRHRQDFTSQKKASQALLGFLRSTGLSERL
uniref:Putative tick transposon n=1 Tax=Rhipicephalus pulchellus TaxID=72859 RepID=L7M042_RHIPC